MNARRTLAVANKVLCLTVRFLGEGGEGVLVIKKAKKMMEIMMKLKSKSN